MLFSLSLCDELSLTYNNHSTLRKYVNFRIVLNIHYNVKENVQYFHFATNTTRQIVSESLKHVKIKTTTF